MNPFVAWHQICLSIKSGAWKLCCWRCCFCCCVCVVAVDGGGINAVVVAVVATVVAGKQTSNQCLVSSKTAHSGTKEQGLKPRAKRLRNKSRRTWARFWVRNLSSCIHKCTLMHCPQPIKFTTNTFHLYLAHFFFFFLHSKPLHYWDCEQMSTNSLWCFWLAGLDFHAMLTSCHCMSLINHGTDHGCFF